MLNAARINEVEAALYARLGTELEEVVAEITEGRLLVTLPESYAVDNSIAEIDSMVARTANVYGRVARAAGIARAEAKLARGRYDRKYRQSREGNNEHAREKAAMDACQVEHAAMSVADALAEMADALENAARIASESARRIQTSAWNQITAGLREGHGHLQEKDYVGPYRVTPDRAY